MPNSPRLLIIDDQHQVNLLCETVWEGNDYVPESFPKWVNDPHATTIGIFEGDELVAICNLELVAGTNIAWVQGLRVKDSFRHKGYGVKITEAIVHHARDQGVKTLWYATSSQNEGSQKVAEKVGFNQADSVGYFRLYNPFPDHPKPSPSILPLRVNASRLFELLSLNSNLVPSPTIPLAWEYDFKSVEGLERLGKNTDFKVVIDEAGLAQGLYCRVDRHRKDELTTAFTIFCTDRAVFVDIMARILDEVIAVKANRAVFFLGPNPTEWAFSLGYVDDEFVGRRFLLYEKNPSKI
jgi:RimJ/RimL family protein N-acetyltransferase